MPARSDVPRLCDILKAIERVRDVVAALSIEQFEAQWERQWLVERGVEIVSRASRHLSPEMKALHPQIPWRKVADIGNVLRHAYESVAAPVMWKLVCNDLDALEAVCRGELDALRKG